MIWHTRDTVYTGKYVELTDAQFGALTTFVKNVAGIEPQSAVCELDDQKTELDARFHEIS